VKVHIQHEWLEALREFVELARTPVDSGRYPGGGLGEGLG
jgi:hypothetical protein